MVLSPVWKEILKGNNLLLYRVGPFFRRALVGRKSNRKSQKLSTLSKKKKKKRYKIYPCIQFPWDMQTAKTQSDWAVFHLSIHSTVSTNLEADKEGPDQTALQRSLIRTFVARKWDKCPFTTVMNNFNHYTWWDAAPRGWIAGISAFDPRDHDQIICLAAVALVRDFFFFFFLYQPSHISTGSSQFQVSCQGGKWDNFMV